MHQKRLVILSVLLLILTVVSGVGLAKTLTVAITQEPDGFGPMFSMVAGTTVDGFIDTDVFYRDDNWDVHPGVVEYLPSIEDGTWVVNADNTMDVHWKLRKDVYWQDGTPLTVKDFIFSLKVMHDKDIPIVSRTISDKIDSIEMINDYECIVHWNEKYPFADLIIANTILPAQLLEPVYNEDKEKFQNHPYWTSGYFGKGAYKIQEWVPGSHIELVKNEDFFLGDPKIDRVIIKFITDTETMSVLIKTGEVDATLPPTVPFDTAVTLKNSVDPDEINIAFIPATSWEHIDLNVRDYPAFRDLRVRKALVYAIDRDTMVQALFEGLQPVAHTFMAPRHPLFTEEAQKIITKYEYNPDQAIALLAMAGYHKGSDGIMVNDAGEKLIINARTTSGNRPRELALQVLQDMYSQIGVKLELEVMPSNVLFNGDHFYKRQWPGMVLFAWSSSPISMPNMWHSNQIPTEENGWAGQNVAGFENARVDELVDLILEEMSGTKRQEYAAELLKIWTDEIPSIPLWFRTDIATWKTSVTGIRPTGSNDPYSWNTWEWDIEN